jgi:hypothetical protein
MKRLPTPKKCRTTHKTKFKTEKTAAKAMMRIWAHDPSADIYDLHTYICPDCGGWHVGHKSYYQQSLLSIKG